MNIKNLLGRRVSHARGFTLIELLVVMAIIAVLATLTMGAFSYAQQAASRNRTSGALAAIKAALEQYKEKFGEYPEQNSSSGSTVNGAQTGGAEMLYQAVTGDGSNAIKLSSGGGTSSDGQSDEEEMRNAINANLPPAMIYPPKSQLGAGMTGPRWLMDGFGRPFQYQKAATSGGNTTVNPTYDLWSFGNQEKDFPVNPPVSFKSDATKTGPWIKNW